MHDGIELERRGLPAAPVATGPFANMGRALAEAQGIPDYPLAVIAHPMGRLTDAEVRARAEEALPKVVELLLR